MVKRRPAGALARMTFASALQIELKVHGRIKWNGMVRAETLIYGAGLKALS